MNFNYTDEQRQLTDTLERWVRNDYSFNHRQSVVASDAGVSDSSWKELAELGLTALPIPEEQGGFNATPVDLMLVMQELGKGLFVEPYFATLCGIEFLKQAGSKQYSDLLGQVAEGNLKLAVGLGEKQSRHSLSDVKTTAVADGDGYVLNGSKAVVIHGAQADWLIVSARSSGEQYDSQGLSLFLIKADAQGLTRVDYRTIDGMRAATITLDNVRVEQAGLVGELGEGWDLIDSVSDFGAAMLCAEAVGAMDALYSSTLEFLKTRKQFGVAVGSFQVLQHRMADMFIELEQSRSMAIMAASALTSGDEERRRAVSAAKARIGKAATFIGQNAIQLHGGIGVTNELAAAHHFKRLTTINLTLGDADHHIERFVDQPGFAVCRGA